MLELKTGLKAALDNYIKRCTWTLSTPKTNPAAFKERAILKVTFDRAAMFGTAAVEARMLDDVFPQWKIDLLRTEKGYLTALDILLDSHGMFVKLNNKEAHPLDVMIPSLLCLPNFSADEIDLDISRWSQDRPMTVCSENKLIATQANTAGEQLRALGWSPSLDFLEVGEASP